MISIVLNTFKRLESLEDQLEACCQQSLPVSEILIWNNGPSLDANKLRKRFPKVVIVNSSKNFGVWSRFSLALNCMSDFILMLDDDTIPGSRYLENCYSSFKKQPGLYGCRGLRFLSKQSYEPYIEFGWQSHNEEAQRVDIVGHSWFFPRKYLNFFWRDAAVLNNSPYCGEDIHFSYTLQKYGNIDSFVPPHKINQPESWGANTELSKKFGSDPNAISLRPSATADFDRAIRSYVNLGFKLIVPDQLSSEGLVKEPDTELSIKNKVHIVAPKLYRFIRLLHRIAKKD